MNPPGVPDGRDSGIVTLHALHTAPIARVEPKIQMMNTEQTANAHAGPVHIQGEMTIYRAHEVAETLFTAVRAHDGDVSLDLSAVSELDTAGLQLILMARRLAEANGHSLSIVQPSECVREVLTLCNVATETVRQLQDAT